MSKLLIDAGTSWSKVLELYKDQEDLVNSPLADFQDYAYSDKTENSFKGRMFLLPSTFLAKTDLMFDIATGHMVKNHIKTDGRYENEVIALAYGAKKLINNLENATIVDLGSRDIKWVKFQQGKYKDLDWNSNCGSVTGATVEMLCKFYQLEVAKIPLEKEKIPVTCGVFAMEKIMDIIASGISPDIAISRYIHGIAYNTWNFARKPDKIYLSGGFCLNPCFIKSLELYCEVINLGRFVILEGLI